MPADTGYFNIERELLIVAFWLERLHHYIFGSKVEVQTDHKPLIPTWKKSIAAVSPKLQWLLLCLVKYDVELTYLRCKDHVIADSLSHVSSLELEAVDKDDLMQYQSTTFMSEVSAMESWLERMRVAIQADPVLSKLKKQIFWGWAYVRRSVLESIHPFWNYRDELAVEDWLIFKPDNLTFQKHEFLKYLHIGHLGEQKTLLRAWECVYWPGIKEVIKEYIKEYNVCQSMKAS